MAEVMSPKTPLKTQPLPPLPPPPPPPPSRQPPSAAAPRIKSMQRTTTTRHRGMTKKQNAKWWVAHRAGLDARRGPAKRETRVDGEALFEQYLYRGPM